MATSGEVDGRDRDTCWSRGALDKRDVDVVEGQVPEATFEVADQVTVVTWCGESE